MRLYFIALTAALLLMAACSGSSKPASPAPSSTAARVETPVGPSVATPAQRLPATAAAATGTAAGAAATGASSSTSVSSNGTPIGGSSPAAGRAGTPGAASPGVAAKEKPEDALKRQLDFEAKKQYGQEWDELHPLQQRAVPRDKFVQCTNALDLPAIQSVQVDDVTDVPLDLQSVPEKMAKEISVTVTVLDNGTPSEGSQTYDEVQVGDAWRWVMDDDTVNAYKTGQCPS